MTGTSQRDSVEPSAPLCVPTYRRWLCATLLGGVALRVCLLVYAEQRPERFDFPDSHRYVRVARNIVAGKGPIDSAQVKAGTDPVYPAILSAGIRLGASSDEAVFRFGRIVNAVFSCASILLISMLGRAICGDRAGLIAAGIFAIDPILLFFNGLVLTETVHITILLAAMCCMARLSSRYALLLAGCSGLLLGLGAMTRSTGFLLVFAMLPAVWLLTRPGIRRATVGLCLAGSIAALAPMVMRNYAVLGAFVPVRTGGGASLMEALGPWADGGPGMDRIVYPAMPDDANEIERDRICRKAAVDWARENPGAALRLCVVKLARTWSPLMHAEGYSGTGLQAVALASSIPVYILAVCGAFALRGFPGKLVLLLSPVVYFSLVHMVFVGSVRYRAAMMPMMFVLAAVALARFLETRTKGRPGGRGATC